MANQSKKLICQEFTARQNLSWHKKQFHSVATSQFSCSTFSRKEDKVEYLSEKFKLKECPAHYYKEIFRENLEVARVEACFTTFKTIPGCDSFQVVIFTPNSKTIKAANRVCLCEQCRVEYGSCDLFTIYTPVIQHLFISLFNVGNK